MNPKMLMGDISNYLGISHGRIYQIINDKKLSVPIHKLKNRIYLNNKGASHFFKIPFKKKVISFQTVKGGVGKTTLCHSIGVRASLYGARVLFMDIDQQANLTSIFNIDEERLPNLKCLKDIIAGEVNILNTILPICSGIDLIPSNIRNAIIDKLIMLDSLPIDKVIKNELDKILSQYDFIFIDCPPAISPLVSAVTLTSDLVISPLTPDKFGIDGLKLSSSEVISLNKKFEKNIDFKVILNKYDKRTILSPAIFKLVEEDGFFKDKLISSFVSTNQEFSNASLDQRSIYCPIKQGVACKDIDEITRELLLDDKPE